MCGRWNGREFIGYEIYEKCDEENDSKNTDEKGGWSAPFFQRRDLLCSLQRFRDAKTFQIVLIPENNIFRVKTEISGIDSKESFHINSRGQKLIPVFFDCPKEVFPDLGEFGGLLQRQISKLPLYFQAFPDGFHGS
ncbi:MAG: hypothetical protein Q7U55_02855 [Deltaproteobacteria bacterium]|nr:hypothetical protein [Deltaproteobacteria bacterium]